MMAYRNIAVGMGANPNEVFELVPGNMVEFKNGQGRISGRIKVKNKIISQ